MYANNPLLRLFMSPPPDPDRGGLSRGTGTVDGGGGGGLRNIATVQRPGPPADGITERAAGRTWKCRTLQVLPAEAEGR